MESAGAAIMQRSGIESVGERLSEAGKDAEALSNLLQSLKESDESKLCSQRMQYASEKMIEAGQNLQGISPEPAKGKSWLKGG